MSLPYGQPSSPPPTTPAEKQPLYPEAKGHNQEPTSRDMEDSTAVNPKTDQAYLPSPLKPLNAFGFCAFLVAVAVAVEAMWAVNMRNGGWSTAGTPWTTGVWHLILTYFPNLFAMLLMSRFVKVDFAFRLLQPYIDLSKGDAPARRSLSLSYLLESKRAILFPAFRNRHFIILSSILTLILANILLGFAGSLFVVRPALVRHSGYTTKSQATIGLDPNWVTLTPFVTAAGFAGAAALYGLSDPPFVKDDWVLGPLEVPSRQTGTLHANTTGIQIASNCYAAGAPSLIPYSNGTGYTIQGTWDGCSASFEIASSSPIQFAAEPLPLNSCSAQSQVVAGGTPEPQFQPIVFYLFDSTIKNTGLNGGGVAGGQGIPNAVMAFCQPKLNIYYVNAAVDLITQAVLNVEVTNPYSGINDVTAGIVKGRAFNGLVFDSAVTRDPTILARANAAKTGLPAAVYQTAFQAPGGVLAAFQGKSGASQNQSFADLFNKVYTRYLAVSAKDIYFVEKVTDLVVDLDLYEDRIFVTTEAAQALAVSLLMLASILAMMHWFHIFARRKLWLRSEPGTIAFVLAFTSGSRVGEGLAPRDDMEAIEKALSGRRYGIELDSGRLVAT